MPQHAAQLLQSYISLGYAPPELVISSVLTAVMLHWEQEEYQQTAQDRSGRNLDWQQHADSNNSKQQGCHVDAVQDSVVVDAVLSAQQLEQQSAAVELLDVLAQLQHHPGERVSGLGLCVAVAAAALRQAPCV